uniref:Prominin 1 n=1 Tax=Pipistrellus kuhlii TaxID=59472 RepID=A0A7J8B4F9_PIPKU|nr:prominin 1 [Pipistrellus kuhlii]
MTLTLGVLLLLGLCQSTISEDSLFPVGHFDDSLSFQLPKQEYETKDFFPPDSFNGLFRMVNNFIQVVQPNAFPKDIIRKLVQKKFELSMDYGKVIRYELGILLCALLGLLFAILMPLVGLCFGLCRCNHKCGGEMHQRQKPNEAFMRKYYALSLLVLCLLMSIGVICGFVANNYLTTHTKKTYSLADSNFRDLRTFLNETESQLNYVLAQFTTTKKRAFSDLDNIKTLLGGNIQEQLRPHALLVLDDIKAMAKEIQEISVLLLLVEQVLWELKNGMEGIYKNLHQVKSDMERSLKDPMCNLSSVSAKCNSIRMTLGQLDSNINLDLLQLLRPEIDRINVVLQTNLSSLVKMGYTSINNIPEIVQNQTKDIRVALRRTLNDIGLNIISIKQKIPIQEKLSVLLNHIDNLESIIYREITRVEKYESYRWLSCLIGCFFLVLIIIFYFLGLLCGIVGYHPKATPITRGCVSNTGGIFLMVGVGVSFFVSWILMLFVTLTFVIGANVKELVCEPYQNMELFQIVDTPYLINKNWKYYLSGLVLNKPDISLSFEQLYRDCKDNEGFYTALQLEHIYNVSEHLNIEEHIRYVNAEFKKIKLNLDVVLLSKEGRKNLMDFSDSGVEQINYDDYLAETAKSVTKVGLLTYATDLTAQTNKLPPGELKSSLEFNANALRTIHLTQVLPLEPELRELHMNFQELQQKTNGLKVKVTKIVDSLDSTQKFITNNLSSIIMQESKMFSAIIISYFEHYLYWAKISVTRNIAACKPLATALDSVVDVFLCKFITEPMNLLWFGIGEATILLLPAIIIAVKLAKYYRRMDSEDIYEEYLHNAASQPL